MKVLTLSLLKYLSDNGFGTIDQNLFWEKLGLGKNGLYITDVGDAQERGVRKSTTYELYIMQTCPSCRKVLLYMKQHGISQDHIDMIKYCGINLNEWLSGFNDTSEAVTETVDMIKNHPLIPADITVRGFIMDSTTGKLNIVNI